MKVLRVILASVLVLPLQVAGFFFNLFAILVTFFIGVGTFKGVLFFMARHFGGLTLTAYFFAAVCGFCAWQIACQAFDVIMAPKAERPTVTRLRRNARMMEVND